MGAAIAAVIGVNKVGVKFIGIEGEFPWPISEVFLFTLATCSIISLSKAFGVAFLVVDIELGVGVNIGSRVTVISKSFGCVLEDVGYLWIFRFLNSIIDVIDHDVISDARWVMLISHNSNLDSLGVLSF